MRPEFFKGNKEVVALSVEEAAILADEISQDESAIQSTTAEIATAFDVQDVIEGSNPEANAFDNAQLLSLSDIVNDMLGTTMGGVVVVDYTPTTEGFAEQAKSIYEGIVKLLKKLWEYIKNFFQRMFSYRDHLAKRVQELKKKVLMVSDKSVVEHPTISVPMTDGKIFTVQGKKLLDTSSFSGVLKDIFTHVKLNFDRGPEAIRVVGDAFLVCIKDFNPEKPEESAETAFREKVIPAMWRYFDAFGVKDFKKVAIAGHTAHEFTASSPALAGSCHVDFTWGNTMNEFFIDRAKKDGVTMNRIIQDLNSSKAQLVADKPADHSNVLTMPAFKPSGMNAALKEVERGLELLSALDYQHDTRSYDFAQRFEKAAKEALAKFNPQSGADAGKASDPAHAIYNSLLRLPQAYSNLAHQPISDLTKRTLGTFEAVLNMVERSIPMYHPKEHSQDFKPAGM